MRVNSCKLLLIGLVCLVASCKGRSRDESSGKAPNISVATNSRTGLTPERRAWMEELNRQDEIREKKDRAELVKEAQPGFRPQSDRAKLAMKLVVEKTRIKRGEPIRYRLEMQNVARDSFIFFDRPHSFVKDGSLSDTCFKAFLTDSKGRKNELESPPGGMGQVYEFKLPNDRYLTDEQKAEAIAEMNREADRNRELMVTLNPGETLLTRAEPAGSGFRPLDADLSMLKPGRYSLTFAYDCPKPEGVDDLPDVPIIRQMRSEPVSLEVLR